MRRTYTPAPALSVLETLRWAWRQLTSMRTALILLFLLAVASIPGSVIPQTGVDPSAVFAFRESSPELARWYDRLGLFHVYSSVWFSAVYVLLMVSLVGCFIPRARQYWRSFRAEPPNAPRNLDRLPVHREWTAVDSGAVVAERAHRVLRDRRYRVRRYVDDRGDQVVAAENGHLREAGNLVFHLSLLVVLFGVAYGSLFGFKGGALVVEGEGFSNTLTQYDEFEPGAWFDPASLDPFTFTVDDFAVTFETAGDQRGAPRSFQADVSYVEAPGAPAQQYDLRVNHPLQIDGTSVFLVGHGYAPEVTVRDGNGDVAFRGPVPFLPQDSSYTSLGVIKAPDAAPQQLGFEGFFLPTVAFDEQRGPYSAFPDALAPGLVLTAYHGDLQMDGQPQSVFVLDKERLRQFEQQGGEPFRILLRPGKTVQLPDGRGSISFDGLSRAVRLQVSSTPAKVVPLVGVLAAIAGLVASLFVRPRRAWVRVGRRDGDTVVQAAGLDRVAGGDLVGAVDDIVTAIRPRSRDMEHA
ncbi:MAG TPA: cytochrome c biogenesis protein ResB [Nocardioidaceae bacterium]|nr:cytochrome c biogenesis protein ResB [Nocardioidaceae bacterium]